MPKLASKKTCTGCAACMNACTKECIQMLPEGKLGHLYPMVDVNQCVECGLCQKSCPILNIPSLNKASFAYAGWAKSEEENRKSSSGGAASVLSRQTLLQGGVVYGCANVGMEVKHIRIDADKNIDLLRGSKYVQSTVGMIMKQVKSDLKTGGKVLFIGTPCQCAGLKTYLRKDYENLLLVDLVCHGTPSLKLLQEHVKSLVDEKQIVKHISFRDGVNYEFSLVVKNAEEEEIYKSNLWRNRYHDAYYNTFILGYTYRPSCNNCLFARPERCSDMTIGDFWGLGVEEPFVPEAKAYGYSLLLPNTMKGIKALESMSSDFYLHRRNLKEAIFGNPQLNEPKKLNLNARLFQWLFSHGVGLKTSLYIADCYKIPVYKMLNKLRKE